MLLKPKQNESCEEFTARFISNSTAMEKFPEEAERSAAAVVIFKDNSCGTPAPGKHKAVINSKTSGRFRTVTVGGREHLVTEMVAIVGNTVMNGIHYPQSEVLKSHKQLNNLLAPSGHPNIEGESISAFHPMAVNIFNIGGFVKNPRMVGNKAVCEFWLDTTVSANSEKGKETERRIRAGEHVGTSTGLGLTLTASNGKADDGVSFTSEGSDFQYDHVATLLNETAAGAHVGTELITNDGEELVSGEVLNTTVNEMMDMIERVIEKEFATDDERAWLRDFIIEENAAIYTIHDTETGVSKMFKVTIGQVDGIFSVTGIPTPVVEKTSFIPTLNEGKPNTEEDMDITVENATEFLVKAGMVVTDPKADEAVAQAASLKTFETNKASFDAYMVEKADALNTKRTECIEATGLEAADVENMSVEAMDKLIAKVKTNVNNSARGGGQMPKAGGDSEGANTASTFMSGVAADKG